MPKIFIPLLAFSLLCHFAACSLDPLGGNKAADKKRAQRDSTTHAIVAQQINQWLASDSTSKKLTPRNADIVQTALKKLYAANPPTLLWQNPIDQKPNPAAQTLINALPTAHEHALNPQKYRLAALETLYKQTYPSDTAAYDSARIGNMIQLDFALSSAALAYSADLLRGRTKPGGMWDMQYRQDTLLADALQKAIADNTIPDFLARNIPQYPAYQNLQKLWQQYQNASDKGEKTSISDTQADLISLNMERFRWLPQPQDLGNRYVWVNIPEFMMQVMDKQDTINSIVVVVGEPKNATPVVANKKMHNVIFSPVWNIPVDIAYEEMEYILKNPAVLIVADVDVWVSGKKVDPRDVDWASVNKRTVKMRQRPKSTNSMGRVKFPFDNNYGVYIHDTPNQHDFGLKKRATSHGCVRVKEPAALAANLLSGSKWTSDGMKKAMYSGKQQYANLPENVSVNFYYFTAWADAKGNLRTGTDVYGYDRRQLKALKDAIAGQ
jgi:murein L,D-transpeptidase YcbB/YkuD